MSHSCAPAVSLREYQVVFWDFDGVIKESVGVKGQAFERLFAPFGPELAARIRRHHEDHGGMSRYEKIPLYLRWAGRSGSAEETAHFSAAFGDAVRQAVVDAPWVAGAREYLQSNHRRQHFVLVTATPQQEIEEILHALNAHQWFFRVFGIPLAKKAAILTGLRHSGCAPGAALMIGDAQSDLDAARDSGVAFLLRRTAFNGSLQRLYSGPQCEDFNHA